MQQFQSSFQLSVNTWKKLSTVFKHRRYELGYGLGSNTFVLTLHKFAELKVSRPSLLGITKTFNVMYARNFRSKLNDDVEVVATQSTKSPKIIDIFFDLNSLERRTTKSASINFKMD